MLATQSTGHIRLITTQHTQSHNKPLLLQLRGHSGHMVYIETIKWIVTEGTLVGAIAVTAFTRTTNQVSVIYLS